MFEPERGTPPPLDLKAVEARLTIVVPTTRAAEQDHADLRALLAYTRALREALTPFAVVSQKWLNNEGGSWAELAHGLAIADLERAAAVLAAAQDGPA